jgi:hypothetical protein
LRILPAAAALCVLGLSWSGMAQSSAVVATPAVAENDWHRVTRLPVHTKVHIDGDKKGRTCLIDAVDDVSLTCSSGDKGSSFSRTEIKSVKLTRYKWSTLAGLGMGFGIGAAVAATGPKDSLWRGGVAGGVVIAMPVIAGTTDMLRGPVVYRRPTP